MGWTERCRGCHYENACSYIRCRKEDDANYDALRNKTIDEFAAELKLRLTAASTMCRNFFVAYDDWDDSVRMDTYDTAIDMVDELVVKMKGDKDE